MCGRYVITNPIAKTTSLVKKVIQIDDFENYNAHPYQKLPVIKKYKNGNIHGVSKDWYDNGQIKQLKTYKNGKYQNSWAIKKGGG